MQTQGEADLAGGWPWQELAERHQFGVLRLVHPATPLHELVTEVTEMRDRPPKGGHAQLQESAKNFPGVSSPVSSNLLRAGGTIQGQLQAPRCG